MVFVYDDIGWHGVCAGGKWNCEECETHSAGNVYGIIEAENIDWFDAFLLYALAPRFIRTNNSNNPFS